MNATERRERFRAVLAGDQCVIPASVYDPLSARIAEALGFEIGFMADRLAPAAVLAAPNDMALLTLTEHAQHVRNMCRAASNISLHVTATDGYGHALNVRRTVEEFESAGVSSLSISDFVMPLRFGSTGTPGSGAAAGLVPLEEGIGKMKAALAARNDPSLVIVAHVMGFSNGGGTPEAIRRVKAYEKLGVDAIHMGFDTLEQIQAIHAETNLPLSAGWGVFRNPLLLAELKKDRQVLARNGVRIVNPGMLSYWASMNAVHDMLKAQRDGKPHEDLIKAYSEELEDQVLRRPQYDEWVKRFMN